MPEFRTLLITDSEMSRLIRAHDWAATPLGRPSKWPQPLRSALSICLHSSFPSAIYWGEDYRLFYNDAWAPSLGPRHPGALGRPAAEVWPDIWHLIEPQLEAVRADRRGLVMRDHFLPMQRYGQPEETYWDYSFTPIADERGEVGGVFNQGQETSERIFSERRTRLLLQLSDLIRPLKTPRDIIAATTQCLGEHLSVGRLGFGEIDEAAGVLRIDTCWTAPTAPAMPKQMTLGSLGQALHVSMRRGEVFVAADSLNDPRLSEPGVAERYREVGIRALAAVPILRGGRYLAVLFAAHDMRHAWSAQEILVLRSAAERLWHEYSRSRAELALRESERRHRLIFEQARDIIFTADLDQHITAVNPAAAEAIGLPAEEIVGRSIAEFVSPGEFERTRTMLQQKLIQGGMTRYEVAVNTAGGRVRQWDVNSALTIGPDGAPIGLHAVARDITEKRAFDERQQLLINELNHRVKNTLALVQGLALQSFRGGRTIEEGQETFQARLAMLAAAHDLLTREYWEGATVSALAADATAPYSDRPGRIAVSGPPLVLTPKAAISLVLALHELGTNAAKYGALSRTEGKVELSWSLDDTRNFVLRWSETGGPPVSPPTQRGFGLRMIERALASDLDGEVRIDFDPAGLDCTITATLPETL